MRTIEWLNNASGARALINHSDARFAIELPQKRYGDEANAQEEIALVMKWFLRVEGEFGPLYIARVYDETGLNPIGYREMCGDERLI